MGLILNGDGSVGALSAAEMGYLDGITSAVQTQLNSKPTGGTNSWISYTPTWTNLTVGNGIGTFIYTQIGKTVHVRADFNFGSTTAVAGVFYPSMPISMIPGGFAIGIGWAFDTSATVWNNVTFSPEGYFITSAGVRANATAPWTWATGDIIRFSITYEAA